MKAQKKKEELKTGWYAASIVIRWLRGERLNGTVDKGHCDTIDILCDIDCHSSGSRPTLVRLRPPGSGEHAVQEGALLRWKADTRLRYYPHSTPNMIHPMRTG